MLSISNSPFPPLSFAYPSRNPKSSSCTAGLHRSKKIRPFASASAAFIHSLAPPSHLPLLQASSSSHQISSHIKNTHGITISLHSSPSSSTKEDRQKILVRNQFCFILDSLSIQQGWLFSTWKGQHGGKIEHLQSERPGQSRLLIKPIQPV